MGFEPMKLPTFTEIDSTATIRPLEVTLKDVEHLDEDHIGNPVSDRISNMKRKKNQGMEKISKVAKIEREMIISVVEERESNGNNVSRTSDDFERLVRTSPNSSYYWINYMNFFVHMEDIQKARSVAERAVRTINCREENEKLNAWVAYIKLENKFGFPPEEAVNKVFERALLHCDSEKLHLVLFDLYEQTEQSSLADELIERMTRKLFRKSTEVWLRCVRWLLTRNPEEAKNVVDRGLLSLPRDRHINFISRAAILEFKRGSPDRGRSLFEGILKKYPKRTDLWSAYLDQEILIGDADWIHALFERAISLSLKVEKMKFFFKKYLDYAKSLGDEEQIQHVKTKAAEYVKIHAQ